MMKVKEVQNKEEWEKFLENCSEKTFLQSWNWGNFNIKMGNKIWRLGVYEDDKLIGVCLVIKICALRGKFLLVPHGPVLLENLTPKEKSEILKIILLFLEPICNEEKISFIRIAPLFSKNPVNENIFQELGFRKAPIHASAYESTWKLDIYPPEEELLKNMRKTTRYLIKKSSQNPDIEILKSQNLKDLEIYQKLTKEVAKRKKFVPFSKEFIKNEFEVFSEENQCLLILGKYKGETVAGALIIFWQEIAFYHQAASLKKFDKFSIPYLIQWQAIKESKKRNCKTYDFWGFIDPQKYPHHPWAGPSLFKMGFGGYKREYLPTQDFVISNKYWFTYLIEKIRKIKRGL